MAFLQPITNIFDCI